MKPGSRASAVMAWANLLGWDRWCEAVSDTRRRRQRVEELLRGFGETRHPRGAA